ncbi:putative C-type lectin domain family 20 member A [Centropristis striata]|uniref:putative C-type lectin domain family 20 member A n=1 Tax=Centropristis striata TaxID=184440 RepID=UPI0027DFFB2F|nr:putative C-type lectin domain family 20 member A [Centropristis striata]
MLVVLLLLMAAPGLCVLRRYHFIFDLKTFTEAQSYCREKYTDLATIESMEDVEILNSMAETAGVSAPWLGLYDDDDLMWRWSLSDTSFYTHGKEEFRQWGAGEPSNGGSGEHCTVIDGYGQWLDTSCTDNIQAVCSDVRGLDVTFVLTDDSMTWTEAQSYCREHHTDLASVRDMTENQKVQELVPAGGYVWIGLFRDSWKWSDGSSSSFRYWIAGQPNSDNQDCAAADFTSSGGWWDGNCEQKYPFICYSQVTSKLVIRLRLQRKSSSLDLNDPAVMEAMLKQLQQKLKDQGLNDDVRLSFRKQSDGKVFHKEKKKTGSRKDEL